MEFVTRLVVSPVLPESIQSITKRALLDSEELERRETDWDNL